MNPTAPHRHILIDFENVPKVDLTPLGDLPVEITLLVGAKNKRLDVALVEHLMAGSRSRLVRLGVSGRNALDITLACYLGMAIATDPRAEYFIISRDKDYAPMIEHMKQHGTQVSLLASIDALPFLAPPPRAAAPRPASRAAPRDAYQQYVDHLREQRNGRPTRRTTLLRFTKAQFPHKITDAEADDILDRLQADGHITVDDKGRVVYHLD